MSENVGTIDLELLLKSDKFKSQLNGLQGQANQASTKISGALKGIGKAALAAFSITAVTKFGKACLDVATETSNAWIGLNSILTGQGKSFSQAQQFIQDYVSDGLVPLNNAVTAYKNLAARGYSSDQIKKTMTALKNSATFGRQSTYSLGEAVQTASEGLKNEKSILVDNAGVTKNVAKMWEDYAKSIGKSSNNLTQQEKITAEVNGILEETKFQMNDASIYANTYSGKVAQLNFAFTTMKTAIGNVIQPIAKLFIPILTSAANAVTKLFTAIAGLMSMFGLKADSVETVSNGLAGVADNASDASDAVSGVGDSAGDTAKKAKKAALQLAGFDEMAKLSDNSDTSSSGSSGSGGSGGGTSALSDSLDVTTNIEQDTTAFDGMLNKVKELASIFKDGFNASFGETNFDGILTHLANIKTALIDIFTDSNVLNSANNLINTWMYALGQSVGAIARIGVNITEGLLGSIDGYLQKNSERIKGFLISIFDVTADRFTFVGNFMEAIGKISDVLAGDNAKSIGTSIIEMFANPFMSAVDVINKFITDLTNILLTPIINNCELIKQTIDNTLGPISSIFGTLSEIMTAWGDKVNEIYTTYLSPFFQNLALGISDTFGKFLEVWNTYIVPFLDNIATGFSQLWAEHLSPLMDKVGGLIGSIVEAIQALWNGVLKPVIDWIIQNVLPKLVPVFESLWNTIKTVFGYISDAIGGLVDFFKGLIDFVVGVFTGDWNKAWEGIKTAFSGIWEAIKGIVQAVWAAIKGIITTAVNIIKTVITTVFNAIKAVITTIFNAIKTVITTIWTGIKDTITNVINGIKNGVVNTFNAVKDKISSIFGSIRDTASSIWNGIKSNIVNAVTNIKNGIVNAFQTAYNKITSIFGNIANFFSGIWNKVKNTFSELGTKIGDSISGAVKAGINGVLGMIENIVNKFVNMINGAIGVINAIPGVNISKLNKLSIPRLAEGGFVKANTPQLAVVGDNKTQGEIISPVDKMKDTFLSALEEFRNMNMGSNENYVPIEITIPVSLDSEEIDRKQTERKARLALATNGRRY